MPSNLEPLASPSDLALRLGLDNAADPDLRLALDRISDRFRGAVGYPITFTADDTIELSGDGTPALRLPAAPIFGTPTVTVDGRAVTDFETGRRAGLLRRRAGWPDGLDNIHITYSHGYAEIPGDIQDAILDVAEAAYNVQAGVEIVTTGKETVKFANRIVNGGVTQTWTDAITKYALGHGDRS